MSTPLTRFTDFLGFTNVKSKDPIPPTSGKKFDPENAEEKKVLYEWTTITYPKTMPELPTFSRSHMIIALFIAFILILMQEFLLITVIGSIVFLWYVLSSSDPEEVTHKITTHGMEYSKDFYSWSELNQFFFSETGNEVFLNIDTVNKFPGRLIFIIEREDQEKIKGLVGRYLTFLEEAPQIFVDRFMKSAAEKINLGPQKK